MFTHKLSFLHGTIVYPTGLRDERKHPNPQVVSCSINRVLPTGKLKAVFFKENAHLKRKRKDVLLTQTLLSFKLKF